MVLAAPIKDCISCSTLQLQTLGIYIFTSCKTSVAMTWLWKYSPGKVSLDFRLQLLTCACQCLAQTNLTSLCYVLQVSHTMSRLDPTVLTFTEWARMVGFPSLRVKRTLLLTWISVRVISGTLSTCTRRVAVEPRSWLSNRNKNLENIRCKLLGKSGLLLNMRFGLTTVMMKEIY